MISLYNKKISQKISALFFSILCALCCLPVAAMDSIPAPKPYSATYTARWNGFNLQGDRSLKKMADGSYILNMSTKHFLAGIIEETRFRTDAKGNIIPTHYSYHRTGFGGGHDSRIRFDWTTRIAASEVPSDTWEVPLKEAVFDKLSYQVQMRTALMQDHNKEMQDRNKEIQDRNKEIQDRNKEMHFVLLDKGKFKKYDFKPLGEELIDTPYGKIKTIKIRRERSNNKRETLLWLAPEWDYLLIKLTQAEDGKRSELLLKKANLDGKALDKK